MSESEIFRFAIYVAGIMMLLIIFVLLLQYSEKTEKRHKKSGAWIHIGGEYCVRGQAYNCPICGQTVVGDDENGPSNYCPNCGKRITFRRPRHNTPNRVTYKQPNLSTIDDIIFDVKKEAEQVLKDLKEIISTYGMTTVADFKDMVGLQPIFSDNTRGWMNLSLACIIRVKHGYKIHFPEVMPIT